MHMKHPLDWFGHALLCFAIALWRWDYAVVVAVTIELVQIENAFFNWKFLFDWDWWKEIVFNRDRLMDLIFDAVGICIVVVIK